MAERYKKNKEDEKLLEAMKVMLSLGITNLKESGFRGVNIEIELVEHIKKELKKGE